MSISPEPRSNKRVLIAIADYDRELSLLEDALSNLLKAEDEVHVLNVFDIKLGPQDDDEEFQYPAFLDIKGPQLDDLNGCVSRITVDHHMPLQIVTKLFIGDAHECIRSYSQTIAPDLIVVGSHGRLSSLSRSLPCCITHKSECPVLIRTPVPGPHSSLIMI